MMESGFSHEDLGVQENRSSTRDLTAFGPTTSEKAEEDLLRAPERAVWPLWRRRVACVVELERFDLAMGLVVALNVAILVIETDSDASCPDEISCAPIYIRILNWVFLAVYTIECVARLMALRRSFFKSRWNLMDFGVLIAGYLEGFISVIAQQVPGMQMLRFLRLGRLFRVVRLFKFFPSLYTLVLGFVGTIGTVNWGFFMIFFMLLVWAMIAVQIIQPDNRTLYLTDDQDQWCALAFSSVYNAVVYFYQTLVTGDSWGECAIPLIREFPGHFWLLSFSYITVQLGVTNLILAVIVDAAARSRDADMQEKARQKRRQQQESRHKLLKLVKKIDQDEDGNITLKELVDSYSTNRDFQNMMTTLNIQKKDLKRMFDLMDVDRSGSLNYSEFIESVVNAEEQDVRIQIMIMKLELSEVSWLLRAYLEETGTEKRQRLSSKKVHTKQQRSRASATAVTTQTSQANLPVTPGDNSIDASGSPKESPSIACHDMPSRLPMHAPLPPVKFVDESAMHLGPEKVLEEKLHQLGVVLSNRLQVLVKDAADEISALVSQTCCKLGNPANQSATSMPSYTPVVVGSNWRQGVEDFQPLHSPPSNTAWADKCSTQNCANKLAQKWIAEHLEHL